jgi:hypothetical protein
MQKHREADGEEDRVQQDRFVCEVGLLDLAVLLAAGSLAALTVKRVFD